VHTYYISGSVGNVFEDPSVIFFKPTSAHGPSRGPSVGFYRSPPACRGGVFRLATIFTAPIRRPPIAPKSRPASCARCRRFPSPSRRSRKGGFFRSISAGLEPFQGLQHRSRAPPGVDGQIDKIALQGGATGQPGRPAGPDRPPARTRQALDQAKGQEGPGMKPIWPTPISICSVFTKLGEFRKPGSRTDTQRSTVAQLTAQLAADDAAISNAQNTSRLHDRQGADLGRRRPFARSTSAILSIASTQTGIVTIAQIEPIAVHFHRAGKTSCPTSTKAQIDAAVEGNRADHGRQEDTVGRDIVRHQQSSRHHKRGLFASRRCSTTRTMRCGRVSRSPRGLLMKTLKGCDRGTRRRDPSTAPTASMLMPSIRTTRLSCAKLQGQLFDRRALGGR